MKLKNSFNYQDLPFYLKFSNWLSWYEVTSKLKQGNWLDIMCGYQAILQSSQKKNKLISEFYCLDQELNQILNKSNFKLKNYKIKDSFPYQDNSFDNITFINGLEHLWEANEILKDCHRILKPGGILQIIVPTWFGKFFLEILAFKLKIQDQICESMNDHKMYYDEKIIWPMLVKAGFLPQKIQIKRIKLFCSLYIKTIK